MQSHLLWWSFSACLQPAFWTTVLSSAFSFLPWSFYCCIYSPFPFFFSLFVLLIQMAFYSFSKFTPNSNFYFHFNFSRLFHLWLDNWKSRTLPVAGVKKSRVELSQFSSCDFFSVLLFQIGCCNWKVGKTTGKSQACKIAGWKRSTLRLVQSATFHLCEFSCLPARVEQSQNICVFFTFPAAIFQLQLYKCKRVKKIGYFQTNTKLEK